MFSLGTHAEIATTEYQVKQAIYENPLSSPGDVEGFVLEGEAAVTVWSAGLGNINSITTERSTRCTSPISGAKRRRSGPSRPAICARATVFIWSARQRIRCRR